MEINEWIRHAMTPCLYTENRECLSKAASQN